MDDLKSMKKKCSIKYNKNIDPGINDQMKKIFNTKSFEIRKSKYGGIVDIRPRGKLDKLKKKYKSLIDVNGDLHSQFNQTLTIDKTSAGECGMLGACQGGFMNTLLDLQNIKMGSKVSVFNIKIYLSNSYLIVMNDDKIPENFKGRVLLEVSIFPFDEGDEGHATALVIDNKVGYYYDSNYATYGMFFSNHLLKDIKELFGLNEIKNIYKTKCRLVKYYQDEPASCYTWTHIFLFLALLNPESKMEEIIEYWGWKIGNELRKTSGPLKYLQDKLESFSLYTLELSKYDGESNIKEWKKYVFENIKIDISSEDKYTVGGPESVWAKRLRMGVPESIIIENMKKAGISEDEIDKIRQSADEARRLAPEGGGNGGIININNYKDKFKSSDEWEKKFPDLKEEIEAARKSGKVKIFEVERIMRNLIYVSKYDQSTPLDEIYFNEDDLREGGVFLKNKDKYLKYIIITSLIITSIFLTIYNNVSKKGGRKKI